MSAIRNLDLRAEEVIKAEADADYRRRVDAALDKMWDWPRPPRLTPRRRVEYTITVDTRWFEDSINSTIDLVSSWNDHFRRSHWNLSENWPVFSLSLGLSFTIGFLCGAWPWQ